MFCTNDATDRTKFVSWVCETSAENKIQNDAVTISVSRSPKGYGCCHLLCGLLVIKHLFWGYMIFFTHSVYIGNTQMWKGKKIFLLP